MIEKKEVKWLANLARLHVDDSELDSIAQDMSEILDFAGQINSLAPNAHSYSGTVTSIEDLRADKVGECSPEELILSNVDGGEDGYFPVKRRRLDEK